MNKTIIAALMLVAFATTLQAKKDPILDAIETSDLAAVRHLIRVSDFDEGHENSMETLQKKLREITGKVLVRFLRVREIC